MPRSSLLVLTLLATPAACKDSPQPEADPTPQPATAAATGPAASPSEDPRLDALRSEARVKVPLFAKALKGELLAAMESGGPTKAIEVCNLRAPAIAAEASKDGWTVGRRSTKLRNPDNAPDAWEAEVLSDFERRANAGDRVEELEFAEIVDGEDGKRFRYAKGIPVGGECLACHGGDIDLEVHGLILERYPNDRAIDYRPGQLRGIFSLEKGLE